MIGRKVFTALKFSGQSFQPPPVRRRGESPPRKGHIHEGSDGRHFCSKLQLLRLKARECDHRVRIPAMSNNCAIEVLDYELQGIYDA